MSKRTFAAVYIPQTFEATWEEFKKICEREGKSINEHFVEWVSKYVEVHKVGNPQTLLENGGLPKTLPHWRTCVDSERKLIDGQFKCNMKDFPLKVTPEICGLRNGNRHCYREMKNLDAE